MSQVVCSICWENIAKNDQTLSTTCGHIFHDGCLRSWMCQSETCPQCRTDCYSPQQIYLTFEEESDGEEEKDNWNASASTATEVNRNGAENAQNVQLVAVKERRKIDADRHRQEVECLEEKIADLEIQLEEATVKEKTLNEEFHYKLQDLNTEFHYKFQDLKKAKEELLENLALARNVEDQLRNNVEDGRRVEDQLRKNLKEFSSKQMELECEKAELQSKLEASEKNARWLRQTIDEIQRDADRMPSKRGKTGALAGKINIENALQNEVAGHEENKRKLEERLRKLRKEIAEYEEKAEKLEEVKKEYKKPKDNCILI